MKTTLTSRKYRPQGFSLAEVTLALAIAAFGITTVLSLLPQGLSNMRKAGDVAAASRISQHILGSLDTTPPAPETTRRFYFDAYAVPVDPAGRTKDDIAYVAEVVPATSQVRLPGTTAEEEAFLRRVNVRLKQTAAVDYNFTEASPAAYQLYTHVIARTGK